MNSTVRPDSKPIAMQDTPAPAALSLLAMLPKSDKSQSKNQDSFCSDTAAGRFAVADGATRLFCPALFSRSLTRQFCDLSQPASRDLFTRRDWQAWLQPSCRAWREGLPALLSEASGGAAIILRNRMNAGDLGGATFAGIEFEAGPAREPVRWRAMVIGDCCLIHLDAHGNWLTSHLIQSSHDFDSRPAMFLSGPDDAMPAPAFIEGRAACGDSFILASDTLAKWLMQQHEAGNWRLVYGWLGSLNDAGEFARHIDELRSTPGVMDDDDITLMLVTVGPAQPPSPRILIPEEAPKHAPLDVRKHPEEEPALEGSELVFVQTPVTLDALRAIAKADWTSARRHLTRKRVLLPVILALVLMAVLLLVRLLMDDCMTADCNVDAPAPFPTSTPYLARTDILTRMPLATPMTMPAK